MAIALPRHGASLQGTREAVAVLEEAALLYTQPTTEPQHLPGLCASVIVYTNEILDQFIDFISNISIYMYTVYRYIYIS